ARAGGRRRPGGAGRGPAALGPRRQRRRARRLAQRRRGPGLGRLTDDRRSGLDLRGAGRGPQDRAPAQPARPAEARAAAAAAAAGSDAATTPTSRTTVGRRWTTPAPAARAASASWP